MTHVISTADALLNSEAEYRLRQMGFRDVKRPDYLTKVTRTVVTSVRKSIETFDIACVPCQGHGYVNLPDQGDWMEAGEVDCPFCYGLGIVTKHRVKR
jgi:hypothetical protein